MKKLVCLAALLAFSAIASAVMLEDFESYTVGSLVGQGWTMQDPASQKAEIVIGGNGTKMIDTLYESGFYGFLGIRDASFTSPITQGAGINSTAHMAATVTVRQYAGDCYYNVIGWARDDWNYGGNYIGTTTGTGGNAVFTVNVQNYTRYYSTDVALAGHTYELVLNYDITGWAATATLYYRDITPGSEGYWTKSSIENVDMYSGGYHWLGAANKVFAQGNYIGEMDNLQLAAGHYPFPPTVVEEDFESYNIGTLTTQGWTVAAPASQDANIVVGGDGTKMIHTAYRAGFYGFTILRNAAFTCPIAQPVGRFGQAHLAATVTVRPFGGTCYLNMIGWVRDATNYGGNQIGTATGTGGNAVFVVNVNNATVPTVSSVARYFSTDVALANHTYELALNYDFVGIQAVTATLYYKDITPGFETDWIKSSIENVDMRSGYNWLNVANKIYVYGTYTGEMDNFRLGVGYHPEVSTSNIARSFPIADTAAYAGSTNSWGTTGNIPVGSYQTNLDCESYFKFHCPQLAAPIGQKAIIESATLKLFVVNEWGFPYFECNLYGIADNSWTESSVTGSNKPTLGAVIGSSWYNPEIYRSITLDVKDYLQGLVDANNAVTQMSFGVKSVATQPTGVGFYLGTREYPVSNTSYKPLLTVEYSYDCSTVSQADLTGDCLVDVNDLTVLAGEWLDCTLPGQAGCVDMLVTHDPAILAGSAVTVNGNLSDWGTISWTPLDKVYYSNPGDVTSAQFAVRWNDAANKLYLAVQVVDTQRNFESAPADWNTSDRIEIYCQGDRTATAPGWSADQRADFNTAQQYVVGANGSGGRWQYWAYLFNPVTPPQDLNADTGFESAVSVSGDTITYEVALRAFDHYATLSTDTGDTTVITDLAVGKEIGFDIVVDTLGTTTFGMLAANTVGGKGSDASKFQKYTLLNSNTDCGYWGYLADDWNHDCSINFHEFAVMAADWLKGM